ncbi:M3 family metallopeptidase [Mycoplasma sp. CSL10166]|uniref:M3 family metallopeptidase n=1 Tax=Mycoplasma sp. CSL10166 TaxID=2813825 RepID=UPI00197BAFBC|nr:M3 family metallopeptidase [Mycoplasma sp. CSL10166]MBN4084188.1 oligoendopeptidase F [Mycoplasma sp. CSL10166]
MKAKQFKKYSDIPEKYKWDLDDILKGEKIEDLIVEYEAIFRERIKQKESKYSTLEKYIEDLKNSEEQTKLQFKIENYISNKLNQNLNDSKILKLESEFKIILDKLNIEFGSETNRFYKNIEKIKKWKNDSRLFEYKRFLEDQLDDYKYKLDDKIEDYLIRNSYGQSEPYNIFNILTNSELDYGYVWIGKRKIKQNSINYYKFLRNKDEKVRKQTYYNHIKAYEKHKDTLAEILFQHFKRIVVDAKIRKFNSAIDMLIKDDKMSEQLLNKLFEQVSKSKYLKNKYHKWYKKFYEIKFGSKMKKWDSLRTLVNIKTEYTIEEIIEITKEVLKPFGYEYNEQVKKALNEKWIDYMSTKTKSQGAYSIGGTYGIDKKYILMNFDGTIASLETLVHELGHSIHSYFSDARNSLINSQYPIFLAEIASIYNELMLSDYLLKNTKNDKFKFQVLASLISNFFSSVNEQVMLSNYEYDLYNAIWDGKAFGSYESISKIYFKNAKKYNYGNIKYSISNTIKSIYVPHYYYEFYVYKYAIGELVAIHFFKQYKKHGEEALKNYVDNFLSVGGRDYPINILKKAGVDLSNDNFYEEGFSFIDEIIEEWIKIGKKIFGVK